MCYRHVSSLFWRFITSSQSCFLLLCFWPWLYCNTLCKLHWFNFFTILQGPPGVLVHPSGVEKPLHECVNALKQCYGDKQGKQFRVWVDQVLPEQVGSDTWLVKFKKWELSGEIQFPTSPPNLSFLYHLLHFLQHH